MTVRAILDLKGRDVTTIAPDKTLGEAASLLSQHKIGALIVTGADHRVTGILSERDIVKAVAADGAAALQEKIAARMTREVVTCGLHDTMADLMGHMTAGRFRHLPVIDNGRLAGIISIGDVVKYRLAEMERESSALRDYIMTA
ncbi:MAG TPA: CBS domain-containing protein [Xanthobacteraceae bacterium]|jgi:CBS domain-containing protein|nr:CBS domain-containing protein [Xanthobacteraceae bacterium]